MMTKESFHIGDWLVEPSLQRISRNDEVRRLEPQLMAVLQLLASKAGRVVTKDELRDTVWAEVIVTENVLTRAISSLRKLLDDNTSSPVYIETISKTGYRLIATVESVQEKERDSFTIRLSKKPVITIGTVILLVVLGAFAMRSIFLPISVNKIYNPIPVANYSNSEYWPSISPDGRFVAYGWRGESDDNWDIYTKLIGTETVLRITDNPATDLRAVWSADGNYLYYLRYEGGGSTIYKKPVTGGEEVRILSGPTYSSGNFDVSPDEKWLAFNTRKGPGQPLQLVLISLENGETRWLTAPEIGNNGDIHPTFSPDGSKLGFIRERNSVSMYLWVFDLQSEEPEQITFEHNSINGFDWTSDGKSLVFGSDQSGLYKLWEVNLTSGNTSLMPAGDYQMVMPRVSSNGQMIYAKMKDNVNIWSYDLKSQEAKPWKASNDLELNPAISNDGSKVAYTSSKDGVFQIWVVNRDGSQAVPITNFTGQYLTTPVWSPDDSKIFFQGFENGQSDIYQVDARGGIPENLTETENKDEHAPSIDANGNIYFGLNHERSWSICRMRVGEEPEKIIEGNVYGPKLNSKKSVIYYVKKEKMGLWRFEIDTGLEKQILTEFHPRNWGAFYPTEKGVYYFNAQSRRIEFYDEGSGESSMVFQPRARIPRIGNVMSLSVDGTELLFTQIDHNDSDIMLLKEQ